MADAIAPSGQFINGDWRDGAGAAFQSLDPASGEVIWDGREAINTQVDDAVAAARAAFPAWRALSFDQRKNRLETFADALKTETETFATAISRETGKPLWEARTEVGAMLGKLTHAANAYQERTGEKSDSVGAAQAVLRHRPHGVMAVYGPYNFPGHLPNGHIMPALLAGNTIVFKPSELTPAVGALAVKFWSKAGLPAGVLNLVQGARGVGEALSRHKDIDGLLFTGSVSTGKLLHKQFAGRPEKILALELGGNAPLIAWDVNDADAAALLIVQSAFLSAGQRCTCARRLIIEEGPKGEAVLEALAALIPRLRIAPWNADPEPFMGPLISAAAVDATLAMQDKLASAGGHALVPAARLNLSDAFVSPSLIDVTNISKRPDTECFGPLLQVIRVESFDAAIDEANNTAFGLAAGLLSDDRALYDRFCLEARAGIINWNRPTTGASSALPFGGIGVSGNHRPSGYYAADYCAYPVASMEQDALAVDPSSIKGFE